MLSRRRFLRVAYLGMVSYGTIPFLHACSAVEGSTKGMHNFDVNYTHREFFDEYVLSDHEVQMRAMAELEAYSKTVEDVKKLLQAQPDLTSVDGELNTIPLSSGENSKITSPHGMRFHPVLKQNKVHTGIDIVPTQGGYPNIDVVAAGDGKVVSVNYDIGYGHNVFIQHGTDKTTMYAHLKTGSIVVKQGQEVHAGQVIAKMGGDKSDPERGWSTGAHLHFEVRINNEHQNPLDYMPVLKSLPIDT